MLSAAVSFSASSASYTGAMPSRMTQSRVSRSGAVEMAKKSVGDLKEADLKGKRVRSPLQMPTRATDALTHVYNGLSTTHAGAGAL